MRGLLSALVLVWLAPGVRGEDWPQWGGRGNRNMVATAKNLPSCFVPGKKCSGGTNIDLKTARNVRWVARLGSETYSSPVVAGGKLFIGTNDFDLDDPRFQNSGGGQVLCAGCGQREAPLAAGGAQVGVEAEELAIRRDGTGRLLHAHGRRQSGLPGNQPLRGALRWTSTAGRRQRRTVYGRGPLRGRPGRKAVRARPRPTPTSSGGIDIIQEHKVWPHDAANCSVLI